MYILFKFYHQINYLAINFCTLLYIRYSITVKHFLLCLSDSVASLVVRLSSFPYDMNLYLLNGKTSNRGYSSGTEELNHLEMIGAIVYQLTKNLTEDEIKKAGFEDYFVDHTTGIYPQAAAGYPYTAASMQVKGDAITDLHEDMAAEQKARTTYDNILRFCDDYDVKDAIRFLRAREVVHYQRFGENLRLLTDKLNSKNFYAFNPEFDKKCFKNELKKKI